MSLERSSIGSATPVLYLHYMYPNVQVHWLGLTTCFAPAFQSARREWVGGGAGRTDSQLRAAGKSGTGVGKRAPKCNSAASCR